MTFRKAVSEPVGEPLPDWADELLAKLDGPSASRGESEAEGPLTERAPGHSHSPDATRN